MEVLLAIVQMYQYQYEKSVLRKFIH